MSKTISSLADLTPDPQNANRGTERGAEMLESSLAQYGAGRGVVVDKNGVIIAGNKTVAQAQEMGLDVVSVHTDGTQLVVTVRDDLDLMTDVKAKALGLADNRVGQVNLDFDPAMLMALSKEVDVSPFWGKEELAEVLREAGDSPEENPGADVEPPIDKAAELQEKYETELGQIWELGEHRLACGDCTDNAVVERLMGEWKADLLFTDPPYGVAIGAKNRFLNSFQKAGRNLTDIESDNIPVADLKKMLLQCFHLARTVLSEKCSVFVCSPQGGELGMMMLMMMAEAGLPIRHVLNWVKNAPTFSMGRLDYEYQHEPILFTWTKTHKRIKGGPFQTSIWTVDKPRRSAEHPTMKPVALPENALANHTEKGDICYEPFSGSGTTIIACENLSRKCRAIELDPGYVAVALERWATLTGQTPELIER